MNLIIFDNKAFSEERTYYYCGGENYSYIKKIFPNIIELNKENTDEIIIYSGSNDNVSKKAKSVKVKEINIKNDSIRIDYEDSIELDVDCATIKKRSFATILKKGLIKPKDKIPFVLLMDINDFNTIKNGKYEISTFLTELLKLVSQSEWEKVINSFEDLDNIENSEYWNDESVLSPLEFSLARVTNSDYKFISEIKKKKYLDYFFKVNSRCIEIDSYNYKHQSLLAFYYYNLVIYDKRFNKEAYDKAEELYQELVVKSRHPFKEKYRFAKLHETRFEKTQTTDPKEYYKTINILMDEYKEVIKSYETLLEKDKIQEKNNYCKCLFSYCVLAFTKLNLWSEFVSVNVYKNKFNEYCFAKDRIDLIVEIENYLEKIIEIQKYRENEIVDSKPEYMFVMYRMAELSQIKGLVYILKDDNREKAASYFNESNGYVKQVLNFYYKQKDNNRYPFYISPLKAINHYFLNELDEIDKCFKKPKSYMYYVWGTINYLLGKKDDAIRNISNIESKDKSNYANAQRLKELINA